MVCYNIKKTSFLACESINSLKLVLDYICLDQKAFIGTWYHDLSFVKMIKDTIIPNEYFDYQIRLTTVCLWA